MENIKRDIMSITTPTFDVKIAGDLGCHIIGRLIDFLTHSSNINSNYKIPTAPDSYNNIVTGISGIFSVKVTVSPFTGYSILKYDEECGHKLEISTQDVNNLEDFLENKFRNIFISENARLESEAEKIKKADQRYFGLGKLVDRFNYNTKKGDLLFRTFDVNGARGYYRKELNFFHSKEMSIYCSILLNEKNLNYNVLLEDEIVNTKRQIRILWILIKCFRLLPIAVKPVILSVGLITAEAFLLHKALFYIEIDKILSTTSKIICGELLSSFNIFMANRMHKMAYQAIEGVCKDIFSLHNAALLEKIPNESDKKIHIRSVLSSNDYSQLKSGFIDEKVCHNLLVLVNSLDMEK